MITKRCKGSEDCKNLLLPSKLQSIPKKPGFWTKTETIRTLKNLCLELGYFPTHGEIRKLSGPTLSDMVIKYGGSKKFAEELGFPTTNWLQENGYGGMVAAIYNKFNGIGEIAMKMGLTAQGHNKGYWSNWGNIVKEINQLIKLTTVFPNYSQIRLLNPKLTKGIKNFGGISEVAKKLGFKPPTQIVALDGHNVRSSYEFYMDNFLYSHGIRHTVDCPIDKHASNFRYDFKVNNYYFEVWGYPNSNSIISREYHITKKLKESFYQSRGLTVITFNHNDFTGNKEIEKKIRTKLKGYGIEFKRRRADYKTDNYYKYCGYWTKEQTIKELKKAIGNYKTFPLEKQLRSDRKSSLAFAINKYGGVNYFRKLLGFEIKKHNQHFWTEKRIIEDLKKIIAKINKFPSQNDLNNLHQTKLAAQVEHKGGFLKFQKLLGFSPKHKPDGYYQNKDNILAECKKLYLQLKHFPTAAELLTLKQNTLRTAIGRSGGYKYFRNLVKEK